MAEISNTAWYLICLSTQNALWSILRCSHHTALNGYADARQHHAENMLETLWHVSCDNLFRQHSCPFTVIFGLLSLSSYVPFWIGAVCSVSYLSLSYLWFSFVLNWGECVTLYHFYTTLVKLIVYTAFYILLVMTSADCSARNLSRGTEDL